MEHVEGFGDSGAEATDDEEGFINRNKAKMAKKKGGGGFQVMGLSFPILKGIQKRGYKIPTPIQRKTIPIALQGRDLVAMARTGSGKTACFLIPVFERLKSRCAKSGARALVLAPTRELALQTLTFIRDIGKFTDLRAALVLGGDSMDSQFEALHGNPDIIVATPGRFVHVCVEMELKLTSIEIVVFDEADRLFEMGFGEQLRDIVSRLPSTRQTLLFSATLPKMLVEFTRAGLNDPILLRLDVESKLPDQLGLVFLHCRAEEKSAALVCLLHHILDLPDKLRQQTIVFAATKHHVEFLHILLAEAGIPCTFLYSSLDPAARKINAAKFRAGVCKVLLVTDVAARGIDIPELGSVINFHFPASPKLFVHRVGRCARAGRTGVAYSLFSREELPYVLDLHMFLGRPLEVMKQGAAVPDENAGLVGGLPPDLLEEQHSEVLNWHETKADITSMAKVCSNAYSKYLKSRPGASVDSVRRTRDMHFPSLPVHPMWGESTTSSFTSDILQRMKNFKPASTVFELAPKSNSEELRVMKQKRSFHEKAIEGFHKKMQGKMESEHDGSVHSKLAPSKPEDLENIFSSIMVPRKRKFDIEYNQSNKHSKKSTVDTDNFVPFVSIDHHTETGLKVNSFDSVAGQVGLDLITDEERHMVNQQRAKKWDSRKKKMVGPKDQVKKIRTESGVWIPATFKSGRYAQWKQRSKADEAESESDDEGDSATPSHTGSRGGFRGRGGRRGSSGPMNRGGRGGSSGFQGREMGGQRGGKSGRGGRVKSELKKPEQILKERQKKEKMLAQQKRKNKKGRKGGGRGRSSRGRK